MTTDIRPGEQVMILRLPISIDSFGLVPEFIDRVYGTGSMMKLDRDQVTISAPREGFGPRLTDPFPDPVEDDSLTVSSASISDTDDGGRLDWTLESSQRSLALFADSQIRMMDGLGAINYVVSDIAVGDVPEPVFQIVVQRKNGLTPHEARTAAEERESSLRDAITEALALIDLGDPGSARNALAEAVAAEG